MSGAAVQWSTVYDASADQTTTITVAGESSPAKTPADYVINVPSVPLADFISYSGAYGATLINNVMTKTYPMVAVDLPGLVATASTIEAGFTGPELKLVTPNATVDTLAGMFKTLANEFGATGTQAFGGEYPIEAIVDVTFGALNADSLKDVVGLQVSSDVEGSAPVLLLENLLAAGKISAATLKDGGGTGRPSFVTGDSLSVFVRYTLAKTRTFEIDVAGTGNTGTFALNGTTLTASTDASESSILVKMVEWKFTK